MLLHFVCRGTDELLGVMDRVHIVNSTLGKALGGAAGRFPFVSTHIWSCITVLNVLNSYEMSLLTM